MAQLEADTQQVFQENQQLNKQSNLLNNDVGPFSVHWLCGCPAGHAEIVARSMGMTASVTQKQPVKAHVQKLLQLLLISKCCHMSVVEDPYLLMLKQYNALPEVQTLDTSGTSCLL